jgi:oligopeptide/dipeptide ABC transporter ATP-binding protein
MSDTPPRESAALLSVQGLSVQYQTGSGPPVRALDDVSFELAAGEIVGLVGESGCGKSTLALALLGLLPPRAHVDGGRVVLRGQNLLALRERQLESIRGQEISLIFQEPALSLNPCLRVGHQVGDLLRVHRGWIRSRCREEVLSLLETMGFEDSAGIFDAYPHQLSGGQQQRVVIAQALVCRPALVIGDEPTASLDSTTQAEIVGLLDRLRRRFGVGLLLISHNPALLWSIADRLLVMYAGRTVEIGSRGQVYADPLHPYTRELLRCAPQEQEASEAIPPRLPAIPGSPPDLSDLPAGCPFEPRCPDRMAVYATVRPQPVTPEPWRGVSCFKYGG